MMFRVRTKLALLMTAVIGGMALLIALYAPQVVRKAALTESMENAGRLAEMSAFSVSAPVLFEDRHNAYESVRGLLQLDDFVFVVVSSANGERFLRIDHPQAKGHLYEAVSPVMSDGKQIGTLTLGISLADQDAAIASATRSITFFAFLLFAIGMAASFAVAALFTRPLQRIVDVAEQVRHGSLTTRTDVRRGDEVGTLATAFNMMLDGIAEAREKLETVNERLAIDADVHRKVADDRQRLAHELSLVLESTGDGIIATDAAGRCVLVNRAARELLGSDVGGILRHPLRDVLRPVNPADRGTIEQVLGGQPMSARPATLSRLDHTPMSVELSSAPIMDPDRDHDRDHDVQVGIVLSFRDVSDRELLRQRLDAARRLSALGKIAASIAHEINNVLMGIQPFAEIIQREVSAESRAALACNSILQAVRRGKRVTSEVLQFTRPSLPAFAAIDAFDWLRQFCRDQEAGLRGTHRIEVLTACDSVIQMYADREQLEQVFANLISNARDAMPGGGVIAIRGRVECDHIHFEVADRGCGMLPETAERIFEPFFTTKGPRGTGLGLAIAEQIIVQHSGEMTVASIFGAGTTFHIALPTTPTQGSVVAIPSPPEEQDLLGHRIIVVEDDENVAAGILAILESAGAAVEVLERGRALLPAIRRCRPDGVVLDVSLPDVDGVDLYRTVDVEFPDLPVVFSTGHADASHLGAGDILARPHVRFLQKPYGGETLVAELRKACASLDEHLVATG